jgi:hypothetical protein
MVTSWQSRSLSALAAAAIVALALAACSSSTGGAATALNTDSARVVAGIAGTVVRSPTVPVSRPGEIDWAPLAGARIDIERADGGKRGYVVSDSGGRFFVDLGPGSYRLIAQPFTAGMFPTPPGPQEVVVPAHGIVQVRIDYDTGIR